MEIWNLPLKIMLRWNTSVNTHGRRSVETLWKIIASWCGLGVGNLIYVADYREIPLKRICFNVIEYFGKIDVIKFAHCKANGKMRQDKQGHRRVYFKKKFYDYFVRFISFSVHFEMYNRCLIRYSNEIVH